jgi:hypothetical protein
MLRILIVILAVLLLIACSFSPRYYGSPGGAVDLPTRSEDNVPGKHESVQLMSTVEQIAMGAIKTTPPEMDENIELLPYVAAVSHTQLMGCPTVTAHVECRVHERDSRVYNTDLDTEQYKRSIELGRFDTVEPLHARQAFLQMLSDGVRSKKDPYTRAIDSPADNWCTKTGEDYKQL